jgi:hypothetical protein
LDAKTRLAARAPRGLIRRMARRRLRVRAPLAAAWIGLALMTGALALVVAQHRGSGPDKPLAAENAAPAQRPPAGVPPACSAQPTANYVLELAPQATADPQRVVLRLRPLANGDSSP